MMFISKNKEGKFDASNKVVENTQQLILAIVLRCQIIDNYG